MSRGRSSLPLLPAFLIPADLFGNQEPVRSNVCWQMRLQVLDPLLSDQAGIIIENKRFKILVRQFAIKVKSASSEAQTTRKISTIAEFKQTFRAASIFRIADGVFCSDAGNVR